MQAYKRILTNNIKHDINSDSKQNLYENTGYLVLTYFRIKT